MSGNTTASLRSNMRQRSVVAICALLAGLLLAGLNAMTKKPINERRLQANSDKLASVMPPALHDNILLDSAFLLPSGGANTALGLAHGGIGYVATLAGAATGVVLPIETSGYGGLIELMIGIDQDGQLTGIAVQQHSETSGLGDKLEQSLSPWLRSFNNRSLENTPAVLWQVKQDGGDFDQFVGATITPRAVVTAVHKALLYFETHRDVLLQRKSP